MRIHLFFHVGVLMLTGASLLSVPPEGGQDSSTDQATVLQVSRLGQSLVTQREAVAQFADISTRVRLVAEHEELAKMLEVLTQYIDTHEELLPERLVEAWHSLLAQSMNELFMRNMEKSELHKAAYEVVDSLVDVTQSVARAVQACMKLLTELSAFVGLTETRAVGLLAQTPREPLYLPTQDDEQPLTQVLDQLEQEVAAIKKPKKSWGERLALGLSCTAVVAGAGILLAYFVKGMAQHEAPGGLAPDDQVAVSVSPTPSVVNDGAVADLAPALAPTAALTPEQRAWQERWRKRAITIKQPRTKGKHRLPDDARAGVSRRATPRDKKPTTTAGSDDGASSDEPAPETLVQKRAPVAGETSDSVASATSPSPAQLPILDTLLNATPVDMAASIAPAAASPMVVVPAPSTRLARNDQFTVVSDQGSIVSATLEQPAPLTMNERVTGDQFMPKDEGVVPPPAIELEERHAPAYPLFLTPTKHAHEVAAEQVPVIKQTVSTLSPAIADAAVVAHWLAQVMAAAKVTGGMHEHEQVQKFVGQLCRSKKVTQRCPYALADSSLRECSGILAALVDKCWWRVSYDCAKRKAERSRRRADVAAVCAPVQSPPPHILAPPDATVIQRSNEALTAHFGVGSEALVSYLAYIRAPHVTTLLRDVADPLLPLTPIVASQVVADALLGAIAYRCFKGDLVAAQDLVGQELVHNHYKYVRAIARARTKKSA